VATLEPRHPGLAVSLLLAVLAHSSVARADPAHCEASIAQDSARYVRSAVRTVQQCETRGLAESLPVLSDCVIDPSLAPSSLAAMRPRAHVAGECCGADHACGTGDDDALAAIGWTSPACPNLANGVCDNPIASADDITACFTCTGATALDLVTELVYGHAASTAPRSPAGRCQAAIVGASAEFFAAKSKALAKCWANRAKGLHQNPCPDPGDGQAARRIATADAALRSSICRACGGDDGQCGGGDDLAPADIGSVSHCPAVTVPGGAACAAPIGTLTDLLECVACLVEFAADCRDLIGVPAFAGYPAECKPPPGTCSAGVMCETTLDCPAGYTCRDNGAGVDYCIGPTCTTDGECGGAGVCRQYCTSEGCGSRVCQCPGFGCTGPDELCTAAGGSVACRKSCTQDSDCVAPFGFVCVNPGFGAGGCIGTAPCQ